MDEGRSVGVVVGGGETVDVIVCVSEVSDDIDADHEWLAEIDFNALITKEFSAPWVPETQGEFDTSHFNSYPESIELSPLPSIHTNQDPFEGF